MIKNKSQLLTRGTCVEARRLALNALEASLAAVDPKKSVKKNVQRRGRTLQIADKTYSLDRFDRIYVIGAGKSSGIMAEAINEILSDKVTSGLVIIPDYIKARMRPGNIKVRYASHPIPSGNGVEATREMLQMLKNVTANDLVLCLISGGGSALMPLPCDGVTLSHKQEITVRLLRSGATIDEINAVRKHLSAVKGGRLAERLSRATLISLIISDVVGDRLDTVASGPTVPDRTTFRDAVQVLKNYDLWKTLSKEVKSILTKGLAGTIPETPKPGSRAFRNVANHIICNNEVACTTALRYLQSKVNSTILTTFMQGEATSVGTFVASLALQINADKGILPKPAGIVIGGETTVILRGNGEGGRNQELVLSASRNIGGHGNIAIASIGTDGIDGTSDVAGAIVDSNTIKRAYKKKMLPTCYLRNNDSHTFFKKMKDDIRTGPTGTNVSDVVVVVCL